MNYSTFYIIALLACFFFSCRLAFCTLGAGHALSALLVVVHSDKRPALSHHLAQKLCALSLGHLGIELLGPWTEQTNRAHPLS